MSDTISKIIIYPAKDGRSEIKPCVEDRTVWLGHDIKSLEESERKLMNKPEDVQ